MGGELVPAEVFNQLGEKALEGDAMQRVVGLGHAVSFRIMQEMESADRGFRVPRATDVVSCSGHACEYSSAGGTTERSYVGDF